MEIPSWVTPALKQQIWIASLNHSVGEVAILFHLRHEVVKQIIEARK
jgi:hypothetical protein